MNKTNARREKILLFCLIAVFSIFFSLSSYFKYVNGGYNEMDTAIISQVFYNTSQGDFFASSIHPFSYLGDHFTPVIFLLLPIYFLYKNPLTLLFLQSLFISLAAFPIYLIAKQRLKGRWALFLCLIFLINPFTHNLAISGFHFLAFAPFLLLLNYYFYQKKKLFFWVITCVLALMVREDVSLFIAGYGLLSLLEYKKFSSKKDALIWTLAPIAMGISYFFAAQSIISSFSLSGSYKFLRYYSWMGASFSEVLSFALFHPAKTALHLFRLNNLEALLAFMLPLLFLPLAAPRHLALMLLPALQHALGVKGIQSTLLFNHYSALLLPGAFLALIPAWRQAMKANRKMIPAGLLALLLLFASIFSFYFFGPHYWKISGGESVAEKKQYYSLIASLPPDQSIISDHQSLAALSSRKNLFPLDYVFTGKDQYGLNPYEVGEKIDYLIIDKDDIVSLYLKSEGEAIINGAHSLNQQIQNNSLQTALLINNKVVFSRGLSDDSPVRLEKAKEQKPRAELANAKLEVLDYSLKRDARNQSLLEIQYGSREEAQENYLIRLSSGSWQEIFPVAWGLQPTKMWRPDQAVTVLYPLPKEGLKAITLEIIKIRGGLEYDQTRSVVPVIDEVEVISRAILVF